MDQHHSCTTRRARARHAKRWTAVAAAISLSALLATGPAQADPSLVDPATPTGVQPLGSSTRDVSTRSLVFSDEFTEGTLDTSKWTARDQERTGNRTDGIRWWYKPSNVRLIADNGGNLAIDISKLGTNQYAGGRIDTAGATDSSATKFDFTSGTVEARIHLPPTEGHLGAFWLQRTGGMPAGYPADGTANDGAEYDIIESNYTDNRYSNTMHYDGYEAGHKSQTTTISAPRLRDDWYHTFRMDWSPNTINFWYDGVIVYSISDPDLISDVPEFPILSHEIIPFAQGSILNAPLDTTSTMYVDYIRVWH